MHKYILLAFLSLCLYQPCNRVHADDDDEKSTAKVPKLASNNSLHLQITAQKLAGIKTQILKPIQQQAEFTAYGSVLSLDALLQLRQQYLAAQTQQNSAKAKYTETHLNLARTENLHHQDIVSTRRLQEQQAQWQTDKANLDASLYQQNSIITSSRLQWGEVLTNWFVLMHGNTSEAFLHHTAQLVQITLPTNSYLPGNIQHILIDEHGQRASASQATLISASPQIDPISQGQRYFFKSAEKQIPFGSHITAWIPSDTDTINGVNLPKSAIVWQMNKPYVYLKTSEQEFTRKAISTYPSRDADYFMTASLEAGEEVVITGAQTLLSQQLKALIPDEDDD
jgi:hypothetical protein